MCISMSSSWKIKIAPRIETMPADGRDYGDFTRVTLTLPAIAEAERKRLVKFWKHYAIFNTHLSYRLYLDDFDEPIYLPALHPIDKNYTNPTSAYCYTWEQLQTLLNDSANKDMYVYDALHDIGFRELQPTR